MKTKAAILIETNKPLIIDELEIPPLKEGQVLVEIKYSGICHTQLLEVRGHRGEDKFLPHLLGHEGSGIVRDVGKNVFKVKAGDEVILSWMKGVGANVFGTEYVWKGKKVNAGAITTFCTYAVISENRLTLLPKKFSLKNGAFLGCALATGFGVVFNTLNPREGQSIAIFGCGGIGLSAIEAAFYAKCFPIIAIDVVDHKLEVAKKLGATHVIHSKEQDPLKEIASITKNLDFSIEATGKPIIMETALKAVRPQGGAAAIIGNAPFGERFSIDPRELNSGKKIFGSWGGENNPDEHFPKYCEMITQKNVQKSLGSFLEDFYALEDIEKALCDLEHGKKLRPILDLSL